MHHLADADGVTLDEEITRLVRAERMRRMGRALSFIGPDAEERSWLDMSAATVADHAGG